MFRQNAEKNYINMKTLKCGNLQNNYTNNDKNLCQVIEALKQTQTDIIEGRRNK